MNLIKPNNDKINVSNGTAYDSLSIDGASSGGNHTLLYMMNNAKKYACIHTNTWRDGNGTDVSVDFRLPSISGGTLDETLATREWLNTRDRFEVVTDKVTFTSGTVNMNYSYFIKIFKLVYFQIYFNKAIASGTSFGTMDSSLNTYKSLQYWFLTGTSNGNSQVARISINGTSISCLGAVSNGWFVTGIFPIN